MMMTRKKRYLKLARGMLVAAGLSLVSTASYAFSPFLPILTGPFPASSANGCGNCHTSATNPGSRNSFGNAFDAAGSSLTPALRAADSDGDGFSNETELAAGFNPGLASSPPAVTTTTTTQPTTTTSTTTTSRATTTSTTSTSPTTTTTTASTTTTTQAPPTGGQALYNTFCASCHDGAAAAGGGRNVIGARTCTIEASINGHSEFPGGVPAMRFLQGILSASQIQAIADFLNIGTVTGQQRYITACAGCHGADARGGRSGENVRGASAGDTREAIGDEREMRFLRCLPRSDINAIGDYLRGTRNARDDDDDDDDDDD